MREFIVTVKIKLNDDNLQWIPVSISEQLIDNEQIVEWNYEEIEDNV
jgi:hypothetical protein